MDYCIHVDAYTDNVSDRDKDEFKVIVERALCLLVRVADQKGIDLCGLYLIKATDLERVLKEGLENVNAN